METALVIVTIIVVLIVIVYAYYGGFTKIVFKIEKQGRETIVYESVTGDYKQSAAVTDRVYYSLLNSEKIATTKGIGIYYDNPKTTPKDKLRSEVGCVVETDSATIARLSAKYSVKTIPEDDYLVTEFPFKGKLSVFFGIIKVYPALEKYCVEHGLTESSITEIYDVPGKRIIYRRAVKSPEI